MKLQQFLLLLLLSSALCATFVVAVPTSPNSITTLSTGSRQFSQLSNVTVGAQGGNVTELFIDAVFVTKSWQGFYGNITGNIRLDDANNYSFYVWGNSTTVSGEVYASRNSSPDWTSINCTNGTQRALEETYLGQTASDGDSITNTFNQSAHPTFMVGTRSISNNSCFSTNVFVNGTAQSNSFHQVLLSDVANNTVYTTIINDSAYGYNNRRMDFQLLVGENEHPGSEGSTSYYFFVELS